MLNADEDTLPAKRRITLELPSEVITWIDRFRAEWGLRSRGPAVERLLRELLIDQQQVGQDLDGCEQVETTASNPSSAEQGNTRFDEGGALVLVAQRRNGQLGCDFEPSEPAVADRRPKTTGGIELPGFVRRQSEQLKHATRPPSPSDSGGREWFAVLDDRGLSEAIDTVRNHWLSLYGSPPNATVLEAAMIWLSQEIWPQVDQSDGRPFTWSLAGGLAAELAPGWSSADPTFERVIVLAGLLEDPFSASTLVARIPTLIRRFVNRFRRRQRGMSFETLENTMSLHGALKLLGLPTTPGHRLTLADIREAYREQAVQHHPDSGGSPEQMRRLNEAYQLLKELYRSNQ